MSGPSAPAAPPDPVTLLKSRSYVQLLVLAAIVGAPVSALAYWFLKLVDLLRNSLFKHIPTDPGFSHTPVWWPPPPPGLAGLLVPRPTSSLPGTAAQSPAAGANPAGAIPPCD